MHRWFVVNEMWFEIEFNDNLKKHQNPLDDLKRSKGFSSCAYVTGEHKIFWFDIRGSGHVSACFDHQRGWDWAARPRSRDEPSGPLWSCPGFSSKGSRTRPLALCHGSSRSVGSNPCWPNYHNVLSESPGFIVFTPLIYELI